MEVIMPKMGESVSEGTLIKWHKKVGDEVKRDEVIFEISTDKVDTEVPSPSDGILKEIKVQEGDTVEVGSVVALIDENGAAGAAAKSEKKAKPEKEEKKESVASSKQEEKETEKEVEVKEEPAAEKGEVIEIELPKMGESVMEGTIIKWHKKVGEKIEKDETLFEISTDKVDTEVPAPVNGVVSEILVAEQETVEVGTIVAKISTSEAPKKVIKKKEEVPAKEKEQEEKPEEIPHMHDQFSKVIKEEIGEGSRFYSPLVMNIAQKENVSFDELEQIKGTGTEGRVTKKDILNYIEERRTGKTKPPAKETKKEEPAKQVAAQPAPQIEEEMERVYSSGDIEKIQMDNIRQKIMQHMVNSRDTSVHVTSMLEVDMSKVQNFINTKKDEYQDKEGIKLTYMPFIAQAAVKALKEFPLVNSTIEESTIIRKKYINLGIAVAVQPTGLIVPNIKNADEKNIIGLSKSISDIAERARNKKLSPDDISGGTFTITNYGVFGLTFGTPIINQPEVAILGVGAVAKKPVVIEVEGTDTIAIKPIMALTLAHDHRLIDGMLGGKFLKFIKDTLENFDPDKV